MTRNDPNLVNLHTQEALSMTLKQYKYKENPILAHNSKTAENQR